MAAPPRFESLPPEIRNMIYSYLLPPAYLKKVWEIPTSYLNPLYWAYVLHPANTAIRRTNRNINREASAVLYRDIFLVSIEWRTNSRVYLDFNDISHRIRFNLVPRGAPLAPYVVRIQQQDSDGNNNGTRVSAIFAAADFPAISRLLLDPGLNLRYHMDEARTSFSVVSLSKMGYNVDKLRELIWFPLLAIREGGLGSLGGRMHRKSRLIDCTGVFEQTTAELDWDPILDDGEDTDQDDESGESNSDDNSSQTDTSGEEDDDEEDIGEEYIDEGNIEQDDSDEEDSDDGNSNGSNGNGDSNDDGSIDEEEGSTDDEGHRSSEAMASKHRRKDMERRITNRASSTSGSEGDIAVNQYAATYVDVDYTYSRPARQNDPLHNPDRSISGATDIPEEFYAELQQLKDLGQAYKEMFDITKVRQDRVLHWLMRSTLGTEQEIKNLADRGVLLVGDAVHAMPILGGEGGNNAMKDGVDLAEHIATHGPQGIKTFSSTRYDRWRKGVEESEQRLVEMHSPATLSASL